MDLLRLKGPLDEANSYTSNITQASPNSYVDDVAIVGDDKLWEQEPANKLVPECGDLERRYRSLIIVDNFRICFHKSSMNVMHKYLKFNFMPNSFVLQHHPPTPHQTTQKKKKKRKSYQMHFLIIIFISYGLHDTATGFTDPRTIRPPLHNKD